MTNITKLYTIMIALPFVFQPAFAKDAQEGTREPFWVSVR